MQTSRIVKMATLFYTIYACSERNHANVVKMVGKYVSLSATTKNGDTPLHIAAARGHDECVEALLQLDAPVMLKKQQYTLHVKEDK